MATKEDKQKARDERIEKDLQKRQEAYDNKVRKANQKYSFKNLMSRLRFETYTKRLVGIITFVGLVDMQLSYVLAFMGRGDIAETLSVQVCTTILGTALIYMIRAYFDNKAERSTQASSLNDDIEQDILNKVENMFYDAGMNNVPSDIDSFAHFNGKSPRVPVPEEYYNGESYEGEDVMPDPEDVN